MFAKRHIYPIFKEKKRTGRTIMIRLCIAIYSLLIIFTAACSENREDLPAGKDEKKVEYASIEKNESKPPLDQNVPEELETATLAMG